MRKGCETIAVGRWTGAKGLRLLQSGMTDAKGLKLSRPGREARAAEVSGQVVEC